MVNGLGPSMELQDLSSNWKKLQQTLKADTTKPPKRKANKSVLQPQRNGVKHRKIEKGSIRSQNTNNDKSKAMGSRWSSTEDDKPSASLALWAEDHDIPAKDLAAAYGASLKSTSASDKTTKTDNTINEGLSPAVEAGKFIAIDCEMVGVGPTPDTDSALARVSVVNYHGRQLYDSFVKPKETVTDYRTFVSGITPHLLQSARTFEAVQLAIAKLLDGKILVGHAIKHDLEALLLGHSKRDIRDTSKHPAFRQLAGGKTPSLKKLAREVLGLDIQGGEHSSIEDARATMLLFRKEKEGFEKEHMKKFGQDHKRSNGFADDEGQKGNHSKKKKKKKKLRK
ncbi:MAG: 3'-5' exonuclease [Alectoria fallacina]|uniref:RNA exonuclease 4 n=1 Tax=Alectoria fallacina TaxID=1903189 RepID=A0A8H3FH57_9LECA|nr:MAG: 3'-5' exonuclease [Alectoria fallacina]